MEQPLGARHRHERRDRSPARRFTEQGDVVGIAAEVRDAVAHPFERSNLVSQTEIRLIRIADGGERRQVQKPQRPQTVIERDHHDVACLAQHTSVVDLLTRVADHIGATVDPHHHRALVPVRFRSQMLSERQSSPMVMSDEIPIGLFRLCGAICPYRSQSSTPDHGEGPSGDRNLMSPQVGAANGIPFHEYTAPSRNPRLRRTCIRQRVSRRPHDLPVSYSHPNVPTGHRADSRSAKVLSSPPTDTGCSASAGLRSHPSNLIR